MVIIQHQFFFLLQMSIFTAFNVAHLRVFSIFNFIYIFSLESMKITPGMCSFFLLILKTNFLLYLVSLQCFYLYFPIFVGILTFYILFFLLQSAKNVREGISVLIGSFYCNFSEILKSLWINIEYNLVNLSFQFEIDIIVNCILNFLCHEKSLTFFLLRSSYFFLFVHSLIYRNMKMDLLTLKDPIISKNCIEIKIE